MYRAVALAALRRGLSCDDAAAVTALLTLHPHRDAAGSRPVEWRRRDRGDPSAEVSQGASQVAAIPQVRAFLVPQQRRIAAGRDIVCEGRDQGTVVFPDAPIKFFITADVKRERNGDTANSSPAAATTLEREVAELIERDRRDSERADGPLRQPADAIVIDTTHLTPDEVLDRLEGEIRKCLPART